MFRVEHYLAPTGKDVFLHWLQGLRDIRAKVAIVRRMARLEQGHFGEHKPCRDGVWELKVDVGAGYRIYYARSGQRILLLLCGGDKRTQVADIGRAVAHWQDWQDRGDDEKQTP